MGDRYSTKFPALVFVVVPTLLLTQSPDFFLFWQHYSGQRFKPLGTAGSSREIVNGVWVVEWGQYLPYPSAVISHTLSCLQVRRGL